MGLIRSNLSALFPGLAAEGGQVTSQSEIRYNCIAWAAGDTTRWWWPVPSPWEPAYWPPGVPTDLSLDSFVAAFRTLGYIPCLTSDLEASFEKVALYADRGMPKHAARQLDDGTWTSKLGKLEDVTHSTVAAVEGSTYGQAVQFMRRPRPGQSGRLGLRFVFARLLSALRPLRRQKRV
jgi:hypothetical protein